MKAFTIEIESLSNTVATIPLNGRWLPQNACICQNSRIIIRAKSKLTILTVKRNVVICVSNNRDDFSEATKRLLANRAGVRCSNPSCRKPTSGANTDPSKTTNIGVAAHICAAASGGPRYDATMTEEERKSSHNGIWLCQSCSKLIDSDTTRYSKETLIAWKAIAEKASTLELEYPSAGVINTGGESTFEIECNRWFDRKDKHSLVCFGYTDIDGFCKLAEGCVLLVAGYTGVGIDMFVQNIVRHNIKRDVRAIYFNLKESSNMILNSMIAAEGFVKTADIRMASLTDEACKRFAMAANSFEKSQLIFEPYDSETSKASYFISAIANGNADIIILDDLDGLDIGDTSSLNSFLYKLRGAVSRSGTIVMLLVDLEENPKCMDKRSMLKDIKINKLAKFCDVIQFLYHDSYNDYYDSSDTKILEVMIAKNYSGRKVGTVELVQHLPYSAIVNSERREDSKKDPFEKYPGLIAGAKALIDCLEKL